MNQAPTFRVADRERVEELLDALAGRLHAALDKECRLIGIRRRGVPVAAELARRLEGLGRQEIRVEELTLRRYADDLTLLHPQPVLEAPRLLELQGDPVLLVDDVLHTGRTLLRATEHLVRAGARRVQTAVLCVRGAGEVPLRADFVGLRLDVQAEAIVELRIPPYDEELGVTLRLPARHESGALG